MTLIQTAPPQLTAKPEIIIPEKAGPDDYVEVCQRDEDGMRFFECFLFIGGKRVMSEVTMSKNEAFGCVIHQDFRAPHFPVRKTYG